jgi:glutamate formiminotransferase/formiminotetrahydrofolate cyclodeaminase
MSGKMAVGGLRAGVEPFIEQLAAPTATPGGGSAAAASGAMAAGLASMVASMSRGKKAYLQYESQLSQAIARLSQLREELKSAIDADAESYNVVMKAYKSAKPSGGDASDGNAAISAALKQATSVPLGVAENVVEVAGIATNLKPITNPNMKSDLTTAIALAKAALEGALANVEINLDTLKNDSPKDEGFVTETRKRAAALKG